MLNCWSKTGSDGQCSNSKVNAFLAKLVRTTDKVPDGRIFQQFDNQVDSTGKKKQTGKQYFQIGAAKV